MSELLKLLSSQYKHLPGRSSDFIDKRVIASASILRNEPFSFQALYRAEGEPRNHRVSVYIETELPVKAYKVEYVAVQNTFAKGESAEFESAKPGIFPDMLNPRPAKPEIAATGWAKNFYYEKTDATLTSTMGDYRSVWFTINPDSQKLIPGEYKIKVVMADLKKLEIVAEEILDLKVIDADLPKLDIYYTNWFHIDCVSDMFGVKPYSNAFYKVFDEYIKNLTAHRQNTLLLPAFTPALDTEVSDERMNVQLVEIERDGDGWRFGFDKMRRFVRHAKRCGVEIFEHCHLFSQWGADNAPNIYDKDGNRIFGYDTKAAGKEYTKFIRAYLTEFNKFAKEEKIEKKILWHISDEPTAKQIEGYRAARNTVADLLSESIVSDAMFDTSFYEAGLVDQPILSIDCLEKYDEKKCPDIALYYTGGETGTTNRKICNTAATTRVLGVLLYKYNAKGFLHWAYNFYYDISSRGFSDPKVNPCAYRLHPGITFLSYPINQKGVATVYPSMREELMREAMDDLSALKLLESKIGREKTLAICEERLGTIKSNTIPEGEAMRELREIINRSIEENV